MENQARLIRLPEVMKKTGFGKAWIYRLISQNRFPQPVKIGIRATAFVESEIDEWIQLIIENSRKHVALQECCFMDFLTFDNVLRKRNLEIF